MTDFDPFCPANRLWATSPIGYAQSAGSVRSAGPAGSGIVRMDLDRPARSVEPRGGGTKKKKKSIFFIFFFFVPPPPHYLYRNLSIDLSQEVVRGHWGSPHSPKHSLIHQRLLKYYLENRIEEFWCLWRSIYEAFWQICKEKAPKTKDRSTKK